MALALRATLNLLSVAFNVIDLNTVLTLEDGVTVLCLEDGVTPLELE